MLGPLIPILGLLGFGVLYFNTFFLFWVPIIATYYLKGIYSFSRVYSKAKVRIPYKPLSNKKMCVISQWSVS